MPLTNKYLEAAFGATYAGLATVGYALKDSTGADVVARTTTGVFEQAGGTYGVVAPLVADSVATVEWDTGGASPVYAHESFADDLNLAFMESIEGGRQEITDTDGGTLTCYADDNATVVAVFELYDTAGVRTTGMPEFGDQNRPVSERVRSGP